MLYFVSLQTCLSKGGGFHFPPCHILEISGFRILFDVPLDLSALTIFSPIPIGFEEPLCSPESDIPIRQEIETPFSAKDLIYSEPWYKTVESLHLWKESSIDVLLISSPMGMLGLPFLTRMKGFSAKVQWNVFWFLFFNLRNDTHHVKFYHECCKCICIKILWIPEHLVRKK